MDWILLVTVARIGFYTEESLCSKEEPTQSQVKTWTTIFR